MAAKKPTPQQRRDRRSKILLAIVGVVFLGVLALQLPKFLKGSGGGAAAVAPPTAAATSTAGVAVSAGGVVPTQLHSFSRFAPKDPFKPRVDLGSASPGGAASAGSSGSTSSAPVANPKPAPKKSPPPISFTVTQKQQQAQQLKPTGPMVPAVLIKINGKKRVLALGALFPTKAPVFQIVGLTRDTVSIRLIGGTLSGGQQTLKVLRGHPVTLLNGTAGTRYLLALIKPTTAPPPPPPPTTASTTTAATTTSSTPPAAPPTTTTG
jgi:hypothetical protein